MSGRSGQFDCSAPRELCCGNPRRCTGAREAPQGEHVELPAGGAVILDELGALAIRTEPAGELAVVLDLGGRLNKQEERHRDRYVMSPGQTAELVAAVTVAALRADPEFRQAFGVELEREKRRLRAIDEEHS